MGHHGQCSADFCKVRQNMTASVTNTESTTTVTHAGTSPPPSATSCEETEQPSSVNNIDSAINATLEDQSFYWLEGSSEAEQEEARGECPDGQLPLSADLHQDVLAILERMAKKANRLLGNFTTNLAECWMSVRCKFDGGKDVFRCRRGSWNARVYGAGLRQLMGHNWSPITWRKVTGQAPPDALQSFCSRKEKKHISSMKSKLKPDVRSRAYKRKRGTDSVASSKKARSVYGKDCRDCEEDVSSDILKKICDAFFSNEVTVSCNKMAEIEKSTRKQSSCEEWHAERKKGITSSNFGKIVKLRPSTSVTNTVKSLLYSNFKGNRFTRYGSDKEQSAIREYELYKESKGENLKVCPVGLVIHPQHHYLAASADGLV